ncbi:MAG TPA: HAD family hydrolase [Alphaproteobacteria bacterium]|nr:HAD family hydrolase [Alphaproteobacteria bacterium]
MRQATRSPLPCQRHKAVFFDRDGCLNEDTGFVHRWAQFRWLPGAIEAIRLANLAGWRVFVVTNQSGVARGYFPATAVEELHRLLNADLARHGAAIDAFRYCPHHPDYPQAGGVSECGCRKPAPGMIRDLLWAWRIDPAYAFMIGDQPRDVAAAERAGIAGYQASPGRVLEIVRRELRKRTLTLGKYVLASGHIRPLGADCGPRSQV